MITVPDTTTVTEGELSLSHVCVTHSLAVFSSLSVCDSLFVFDSLFAFDSCTVCV